MNQRRNKNNIYTWKKLEKGLGNGYDLEKNCKKTVASDVKMELPKGTRSQEKLVILAKKAAIAFLMVKKSERKTWQNFGYKLDSSYWQINQVLWQTIWPFPGKRSRTDRSFKHQNSVLVSSEEILARMKECFKDILGPVTTSEFSFSEP